jgi:Aspartyl protease/PDZ domain
MTRFILLAALVASVAPVRADDKPAVKDEAPIVVPFEMLPSRHFVISVKLNDKGPYRMILDTGAPLTLITSKAAKESGLTKKAGGGGGLAGLLGGINQVSISKLQVGDVVCEKTPAVVMDHPTVKAISDAFKDESGPIEGLVGFPFFGRYAMTIDYQKKQLTMKPNGYKPGDYMQDMMNTLSTKLMNRDAKSEPKTVTPAGLWGFTADKDKSDEDAGVTVKKVYADAPMGKAGLKAGDRLLTIDGRWTDSLADAAFATSVVKPGKAVPVVVSRDGKEITLTVTPVGGK